MFKFYEVGGKVRDELLGLRSKDIDYVAVPDEEVIKLSHGQAPYAFTLLVQYLSSQGYDIFLVTHDCFTVRARFPASHKHAGTTADFVMARKEEGYYPGTRKPIIKLGTLHDDLARRDFTVNAIARDEEGVITDPFNGRQHLGEKLLVTPLDTEITFNDDPLRILRAIRFSITKHFSIPMAMHIFIDQYDYEGRMYVVSEERIREELYKCFWYDTRATMLILNEFTGLRDYIFGHTDLWLKPTNEDR